MQKLIWLLPLLVLAACHSKSNQYKESDNNHCWNNKIQSEYIVHWHESPPTRVHIPDVESYLKINGKKIAFIEPNYKIKTTQTLRSSDYNNDELSLFEKIGATSAWNRGFRGQNILIAIIDSGVAIEHPILKSNIFRNQNEIASDGVDNDQNVLIDDIQGWNFSNNSNQIFDEVGHGTAMASLITGSFGLAKDAKLLPLDIMSDDTGSEYDAKRAVDYAIQMQARIINNSWSTSCSHYLASAFQQYASSNVIFINAAGNNPIDVYKNQVMLSSIVLPNFINVGSLSDQNQVSLFSGYGQSINMWTYGEDISVLSIVQPTQMMTTSGTSLSAALVSGAVALVWSAHPNESASKIISRVMRSSQMINGKKHLSIQQAIN